MRKHLLTTLVLLLLGFGLNAQESLSDIQAVYDICWQMRASVGAGNTSVLREASQRLKECRTEYFYHMDIVDEEAQPSLNGHFVFDYEFVDSLIVNRAVYEFAERYAERCAERTTSFEEGMTFMRTCMVGAQSSLKFTFKSCGPQELAFVTEPGGMITVRVHDETHNKWYNDDTEETNGLPSRIRVFELPDERSLLEVEVMNRSEKEISFVVISN